MAFADLILPADQTEIVCIDANIGEAGRVDTCTKIKGKLGTSGGIKRQRSTGNRLNRHPILQLIEHAQGACFGVMPEIGKKRFTCRDITNRRRIPVGKTRQAMKRLGSVISNGERDFVNTLDASFNIGIGDVRPLFIRKNNRG